MLRLALNGALSAQNSRPIGAKRGSVEAKPRKLTVAPQKRRNDTALKDTTFFMNVKNKLAPPAPHKIPTDLCRFLLVIFCLFFFFRHPNYIPEPRTHAGPVHERVGSSRTEIVIVIVTVTPTTQLHVFPAAAAATVRSRRPHRQISSGGRAASSPGGPGADGPRV